MANLEGKDNFDYSFVNTTARIAVYDDFKSAPHVVEVNPAKTNDFIEKLTTTIYEQVKLLGGIIPYTLIREVSENFIHAQFKEIVVSVLDGGNTVRFADQGPGIYEKEKAQEPGFTSATEPMKRYIRGVGSGFPLVRDYLDSSDGSIAIEDNLNTGAVVTISLEKKTSSKSPGTRVSKQEANEIETRSIRPLPPIPLSQREKDFLIMLMREGELGITDLSEMTETPVSTTYNTLKKLEEAGLAEKTSGKKRWLTELGYQVAVDL